MCRFDREFSDAIIAEKLSGKVTGQNGPVLRTLLLFSILAFSPFAAHAANITVVVDAIDTNCSDGACDFQSALDFAATNGEADVLSLGSTEALTGKVLGTAVPFVYTSSENYPLEIKGIDGGGATILSGGGVSQVLRIENTANPSNLAHITLRNLHIWEGNSIDGGGLYVFTRNANLTIEDCSFSSNYASTSGGGAWVQGYGTVTITHSRFEENLSGLGAGLYLDFGTITMTSNVYANNKITGACKGGGAYVTSNWMGPLNIQGNWFDYNESAAGIQSCQGAGLYLYHTGEVESVLKGNHFRWNQLGHRGSGAGAYVHRNDGLIKIQGNIFTENIVGGTDQNTGGGGLWAVLYGSFAEASLLNNAFVGNQAPFSGKAAGINCLDTAVLFASNTVYHNRPFGNNAESSAVKIAAPGANVYNNIFWDNSSADRSGYDLYIADQGYVTENVNLQNNNLQTSWIPPGSTGTSSGNTSHLPLLAPYPDFHIASRLSLMVDSAPTYTGMPDEDIDGNERIVDGDSDSIVMMDKGADELGSGDLLVRNFVTDFVSNEMMNGDPEPVSRNIQVINLGDTDLLITAIYLVGGKQPSDWQIIDQDLRPIFPGLMRSLAWLVFQANSRHDSNNTFVLETSAGTFTAELTGKYLPQPHSDLDGVSDLGESGPIPTFNVTDYDGDCDGQPDREQPNVVSFPTRTGHYITLVAPMEGQKIGDKGDNFAPGQIPFFMDVRTLETAEKGSGLKARSSYPYGFFSFRVATGSSITGGPGVGGFFPVSIILPEDGPEVNGYTKNGPTPEEGWFTGRPPGGVGEVDFGRGTETYYRLSVQEVGADWESVTREYPKRDGSGYKCEMGTRQVVHLRLIDGELGDYDLAANGVVVDPGGPAYDPVFHGSTVDLTLADGGASAMSTPGIDQDTKAGYAELEVNSGTNPYGTAVFSFRQNLGMESQGVTVSEAGIPSSMPTTSARLFIDYRTNTPSVPGNPGAGSIDINTGIAVVNPGSATANVTYTLRDRNNALLAIGDGTIEAGHHFAKFISQFAEVAPDFLLPEDFPTTTQFGSLEVTSDQALSITALRGTINQRGEFLMTTTPVADLTQGLHSAPIYFPQFVDGGGYTTSLILLNTSQSTETGTFQIMDNDGNPLPVTQAGGSGGSEFEYEIPAYGLFHFQTSGSPAIAKIGWVKLTPDAGTSTPIGSGVFAFNPADILVTESGIPSAAATTHARIYVDLSGNYNTGLAIANVANSNASIELASYRMDGTTAIGSSSGPLQLSANGHTSQFANQFIEGLPAGFTGVLDISSSTPFAALTIRSLVNERQDYLITTLPIADANLPAPSPIIFPQIADGGGYTTQFILINPTGETSATLLLYSQIGAPLD
jgi:hypothetical protein